MVEIQEQYSKVKKIDPWTILCPQIGMNRVNNIFSVVAFGSLVITDASAILTPVINYVQT